MQEDRIPKIFISYSWSSDDLVVPLAERLVSHGVEVVLDKWDLKEGQDKYAFMEQCVTDPTITRVLIICDKAYADKANARIGGVGDETVIISQEVYGRMKQEKFIPIIAERDENGDAYTPTYIGTRIYIDLSNEGTYEENYEKLLRNIYEKPLYRKPQLGKRPEWLDDEKTNLFPLTDLIRQLKGAPGVKKQQSCANRFVDEYICTLKSYRGDGIGNPREVYERFMEMKPVRDVFLDFIVALDETDISFSEVMCNAFEKIHNELAFGHGFASCSDYDLEIYRVLIWELFICTIVYLRHTGNYENINGIVGNTYFLTVYRGSPEQKGTNYCTFRHHSSIIEERYKPTTTHSNKFTLLGNTLCKEREKLPIFSGTAIAEADLFLYQIKNGLDLIEDERSYRLSYWFPTCYVYCKNSPSEWMKLKSRKFCQKIFPLFGVSNIDGLKKVLENCSHDSGMRYNGCFEHAPSIQDIIKIDEIGTVN